MKAIATILTWTGLFACGVFFGGTREFSLIPVLFIFWAAFCAALLAGDTKKNLIQTFKFPPFLAGIAFCAYIGIGQLNVWMQSVMKYGVSDIYYKNFILCLPSGVDAIHPNFHTASTIAAMALVCIFCMGALNLLISKPSDCIPFCLAIAAGAMGNAFAAFMEFFDSQGFFKVWTIYDRGYAARVFGSFFSRNQGTAYMLVGMCALTAIWARAFFEKHQKISVKTSARTVIFICALLFMIASVSISESFGSFILMVLLLAILLSILTFQAFVKKGKIHGFSILGVFAFMGFAALIAVSLKPQLISKRISNKFETILLSDSLNKGIEKTDGGRSGFYAISFDMIKNGGFYKVEKPFSQKFSKIFFGSGANSYGNVSAVFLANDARFQEKTKSGKIEMAMLTYAHCDPLQIIFEYGLFWSIILFSFLARWVYVLIKAKFWRSAFASIIAIPLPAMLLYSCSEIIFYNPFVSAATLSCAFIAYKYSQYMSAQKTGLTQKDRRA